MTSLDLFRLDGQAAVVVGGAGGLGAAMARGLAEAGAAVAVADASTGAAQPTASRNELANSVTCCGVFTFLLKIIRPQGWASLRNARSSAETLSPLNPVMNARAAIGAD